MFDPKILVSPKDVLLSSLKGALNEILLTKDNTHVVDVKQNSAYYNTIAVVNNVDEQGNVVRERRDVWYDRVVLPSFGDRYAKTIKTDRDIAMYSIVTDTVQKTEHNATPTQLVKAMSHTYATQIDESDLRFDSQLIDSTKNTAIGKVYSTFNCEVRGNTMHYVGGYCTAPRDDFNSYYDHANVNDIQPGMSIVKEWNYNDTLNITLPTVQANEDWNIVVEDIQDIGNTAKGNRILDIITGEGTTSSEVANRWLMTVDDYVFAELDKSKPNVVSISITDGVIHASGRDKEDNVVNIESNTTKIRKANGLYRITVYTKNLATQPLSLTMNVVKPETNDSPSATGPSELINFEPSYNAYNGLKQSDYLLDDNAGILSGYYFGGLKYNVDKGERFNVNIFNGPGQGGDYSGIGAGGSNSIVVLEEENYIQTLRNGYNTDFAGNDILRVGDFFLKDDYGNKLYVNDSVVNESDRGSRKGIEVTLDYATNEVTYGITYETDYQTKETETYTGVLDADLSRFTKPIVIVLNCIQANMTYNIIQFQIESTPLPLPKNNVNDIVKNCLISAKEMSTAVVGGFDKPLSLTNNILDGYTESTVGSYRSKLKYTKDNTGNVTTLLRFQSDETVELTGYVYDFGRMVDDKTIKQFYIEINNTLNVLSKFKFVIDVTESEATLTVINDGVVIQTRSTTVERYENNPFIVTINATEMSVTYGGSKKISNPSHNYVGLIGTRRYRVEMGVVTTPAVNLPELNITQSVIPTQGEL